MDYIDYFFWLSALIVMLGWLHLKLQSISRKIWHLESAVHELQRFKTYYFRNERLSELSKAVKESALDDDLKSGTGQLIPEHLKRLRVWANQKLIILSLLVVMSGCTQGIQSDILTLAKAHNILASRVSALENNSEIKEKLKK